jgi:hypothetical protein
VFNGWKDDSAVPGTLLIVNYDSERELRRKLGVRTQGKRMNATVVDRKK